MPPTDELSQLSDDHYLDDDGFTGRTLQRLPPPRHRWRRPVLGAALLMAVLIAGLLAPDLAARIGQAASATARGTLPLTALAIALVLTATLVILRDERS